MTYDDYKQEIKNVVMEEVKRRSENKDQFGSVKLHFSLSLILSYADIGKEQCNE